MYEGPANPNVRMPLEKMRITNLDVAQKAGENPVTVLYNPQSYVQSRSVDYSQTPLLNSDKPLVQFTHGSAEILQFDLFLDSISAGGEVGGTTGVRQSFESNQGNLSRANQIDVRDHAKKIYDLMTTVTGVHRPPRLKIEWGSLQFIGFLTSCTQQFVKFSESGDPVRAQLQCQFIEHADLEKEKGMFPLGSPDTTKYRTLRQGDSLWALSAREYGEVGQWREIARANGIVNPRRLRCGDVIVIPALVD